MFFFGRRLLTDACQHRSPSVIDSTTVLEAEVAMVAAARSARYAIVIAGLVFLGSGAPRWLLAAPGPNSQSCLKDDPPLVIASAMINLAMEATDDREFMSGEITAIDEDAKTITLRVDQTTEDKAPAVLVLSVDKASDITDGDQDRTFASLTVGSDVDVEYNSVTKTVTYMFIY